MGRIAEVVDRPLGIVPVEVDLVRRERLARSLSDVTGPTGALYDAFDDYQRDLDLLGISDARCVPATARDTSGSCWCGRSSR